MNDRSLASSFVLAVALLMSALPVSRGLERFRAADRSVSVKGVAERTVQADIGLWPVHIVAADNVLDVAQLKIARDRRTVMAYLARFGLDSTAVELQGFEVSDTRANSYESSANSVRFVITATLMVRAADLARLREASQSVSELAAAGVVLSSGGPGNGGPTYLFTRLNDLKPAMLNEATASARQAADEFARQSGSHVGAIRRASQGVFEILPRDQAPGVMQEGQIQKTLRVVATLEYELR